jgi:hypothetical protein
MSKRENHSNEKPPPKRPRGFRLARSNFESSASLQVPTSSSLFVTVNDDERGGKLFAQTRLLSRTVDSSASPLPPTDETGFEPQNEPQNDVTMDSPFPMEETDPPPQLDIPPKPKRKRYTTNVVSG